MANIGGSSSAEFGAGVSPLANPARGNARSLTLGGSLQADSDRFNAMTPRGVLASATGGPDDGTYERFQRDQGGYAPGSMEQAEDQLTQGTDDNAG